MRLIRKGAGLQSSAGLGGGWVRWLLFQTNSKAGTYSGRSLGVKNLKIQYISTRKLSNKERYSNALKNNVVFLGS